MAPSFRTGDEKILRAPRPAELHSAMRSQGQSCADFARKTALRQHDNTQFMPCDDAIFTFPREFNPHQVLAQIAMSRTRGPMSLGFERPNLSQFQDSAA